ncbi:hypothetical protein SOQ14_00070 [Erythrobacter sp. T5W1-R]|uniref:hypothetical protein n=1 Tax=Erythrobacter sp. T5W1-R TaxID=3101752 RepID=UPI002AFEEC02|nr:hypothetical protein [Erythrobacter sp. T5W1-R]MEA1617307.1 hypothetical protein [Erythrobacter sp. T5W1-R]
MSDPLSQFALLSEAGQLAVVGAGLWVLAGVCGVMDYRRGKRRDVARLEQVGWVPWLTLFMLLAIIGGGLLALSLPAVIGSL